MGNGKYLPADFDRRALWPTGPFRAAVVNEFTLDELREEPDQVHPFED